MLGRWGRRLIAAMLPSGKAVTSLGNPKVRKPQGRQLHEMVMVTTVDSWEA